MAVPLTLLRMDLFGSAHGGREAKRPPSLKSVTNIYNDETWHSYTLPKQDPKNNHMKQPLSYADINIFSPEISKFCYIRKYKYRLYFNT